MKRRQFLTMLGASTLAPALPLPAMPAAARGAGYTRYMYGLAVFQARPRASVTAADLVTRLGVSTSQASAMMGEMSARGVLSAVTGAVQSASPRAPYVRKILRHVADQLETPTIPADPAPDTKNTQHPLNRIPSGDCSDE